MITERAVEIVNSLGVINVTYNDNPVWIENIQSEDNKAHVKDLKTNKIMEVPISSLIEK